ncbi:MAG: NAD(+)/NADH kinase [Nitrososphaeraceae archaeon]
MRKHIRNIAITTKKNNQNAENISYHISDLLNKLDVKVHNISFLKNEQLDDFNNENLDVIIAIGGDGTTLRTFRSFCNDIPVLSINAGGNRGILSESQIGSVDTSIKSLINGDFFYDSRIRIQASASNQTYPPALNDILFLRSNLTRTPSILIKFRDHEIIQRMDGLLISTPTGSTGHSISFGDSIIHEELDCMILNPIACLNRMPSMVIPCEELYVQSNHECAIIIDGQEKFILAKESPIRISKFPINARFIRFKRNGLEQLKKLGF